MPETSLRIAKLQVVQQERLIADQRKLISRLRAGGLPTDDAENFLKLMYDILAFRQIALGDNQLSRESSSRVH